MSDWGDPSEKQQPIAAPEAMETFVEKWQKSGGSERSSYQLFLSELARLLDTLTELGEVQQDGERYFVPKD